MAALLRMMFLGIVVGCASGAQPKQSAAGEWQDLFNGETLAGWAQSGFEGEGEVKVVNPFRDKRPAILIQEGVTLSGITWTRGAALPKINYELTLEVMKVAGSDFFCGLTFPVGATACSFIVGGWGGNVVGISSVDHSDAADNDTTSGKDFELNRWYKIRVKVTDAKIECWIDAEQVVDLETAGRKIGLRPGEIQKSLPLGLATYMTRAAVRDVKLRRL